jgi:hypothetical protein
MMATPSILIENYIDRKLHGSDTIRLADINASELGQPNSTEAADFLTGLVYHKAVYLDIDDKYIFDYNGMGQRLVCVVYVDYNSTHYRNVNEALWETGLAEKKDYDNEFDPDTWTLYVSKQEIPEFQSILILPIFMTATLLAAMLFKRKRAKLSRATCVSRTILLG